MLRRSPLVLAGAVVLLCAAMVGLPWGVSASGTNTRLAAPLNPILSAPLSPVGTTITVNSTDDVVNPDDGKCTLREAVTAANTNVASGPAVAECVAGGTGSDTIQFTATGIINLTSGELLISESLAINGPGPNQLTVQRSNAASAFRIFTISSGTTVNISGLTISNGSSSDPIGGGAIYNDRGTLTITNCAFNQNSGTTGGAIYNSGIFGTANLTIINSTFSQNSATSGIGQGGAIYSHGHDGTANLTVLNSTFSQNAAQEAGGILNVATTASSTASLKVFNSTFSQNTATTGLSNGGAIANAGDFGGTATVTVINSTLSQNSAANGGAIFNFQNAGIATLQIGNTILKKGGTGANFSNNDTLTSLGHNLSDDPAGGDATTGPGGLLNQPGDQRNTNPLLGSLASNGGPTQTHLLLPGSPAINAGSNTLAVDQNNIALTTDQRGTGFPRIVNSTVDIGAVEVSYGITATAGTPQSTTINTVFPIQLQATVTESGNPQSGLTVTFTAPASGASGTFPGNTTTSTPTSDGSGRATAPLFTANGVGGGPYTLVASLGTGLPTATFSLTNDDGGVLRIDTVTPHAGRTSGGQQIQLTGAFAGLSTVTMGGASATWSYTNGGGDTTTITVTTPAHAVGAVQIDLTPTSGNPYSKANAFAYLPTVFTDNTLTVGATTAKAQHIIELRQAVDAMRAVAGLAPAPWTDPTISPTSTIIKAVHILELRTYLDNAASLLGYATSPYTDPSLTTGFVIKKVHIEELRQRIRTIAG